MLRPRINSSYQPVNPSGRKGASDSARPAKKVVQAIDLFTTQEQKSLGNQASQSGTTILKRGHQAAFAALFAFTTVLYARPSEFYPSPLTASIALVFALIMLAFFIPTQLSLEGTLTARPREVNLVLLFCLTGLLSIPLALNPGVAWGEFSGNFIRCIVVFIVMVNVVRTRARLKGMLLLALAAGLWLSLGAINDYRLGLSTVEGYRVTAEAAASLETLTTWLLFLVTVVPVVIALGFNSRRLPGKLFYAGSAILMFIAIALTYSRGGFLGRTGWAWFLRLESQPASPRSDHNCRLPGGGNLFGSRPGLFHSTDFDCLSSLDPVGSSDARRGELFRSLYVAIRHPLLGIGMGNYAPEMSHRGLVSHNSYTQVASEMGMAALVFYTMFIVTPLKKLGQIARETLDVKDHSHFYYLAIGLQASLLAYMVSSFFASVAYLWYVYYAVGFAICFRRIYESETGREVVITKPPKQSLVNVTPAIDPNRGVATT
jgi:hypothetical protein